MCALNSAFALSYELSARVLFVDANSPVSNHLTELFPYDVDASYLDTDPKKDTLNTDQVASLHGLDYIQLFSSGAMKLEKEEGTQVSINTKVLSLAINYDYVVIDLGALSAQRQLAILDFATDIVLVTRSDPISIHRLKSDYELLKSLRYPTSSIRVLVNDWFDGSPITQDWLDTTLGVKALGFVPMVDLETSKTQALFPFLPEHVGALKKMSLAKPFISFVLAIDDLTVDQSALYAFVNQAQADHENEDQRESRQSEEIIALERLIQSEILESLELKHMDVSDDPEKLRELEVSVERHAVNILDQRTKIRDRQLRQTIIKDTINNVLYLGPLMNLLADESVSEIMVNHWQMIFVERRGKLSLSPLSFFSEGHLRRIISRIVSPIGRRVDVSSPMVDARLIDGSRVNVIIPPLATKGSVLTIRKFDKEGLGIDDLVGFGTLNHQLVRFLEACVKSRMNIIISGGTGSGKTTMLNILSAFIPENERVITVEDSAELQLRQDHVITLEARPPNIEGEGEVTIRDLVKNALRMRPDRIVVGECRAGEALDMLQAMNTGHDGSMTTIHANSSKEMLSRIETLVMYAGTELPSVAIKQQICGAVNIIIQISRLKSGARKIMQVSEVKGMDGDEILVEDIFRFKTLRVEESGEISGDFVSTGYLPKCYERFGESGLDVPQEMFWAS